MNTATTATQKLSLQFPTSLVLDTGSGETTGEIPWDLFHQVQEKCRNLSLELLLGDMALLFIRCPEIDSLTFVAEESFESNDQGGFVNSYDITLSGELNAPICRKIAWPGFADNQLDLESVEDNDQLQEALYDAIVCDGDVSDAAKAVTDSGGEQFTLKRTDIADLLAKPELDLSDIRKRIKFE